MNSQVEYRNRIQDRWADLKKERSSWISHWQDISKYVMPRNGRYIVSDRNKGTKRYNKILDSSGTKALKILGAGMMAGATSPARQWFKLGTSDPDLNNHPPMKRWLAEHTTRMSLVFQRSNTYRALHSAYEEMGAFGTAASIILPNHAKTIHHYSLTTGEYALDVDDLGNIDCLYREFEKTVRVLVAEFGYNNCSNTVKRLYDRGQLNTWIPVIHCIEPRTDRDHSMLDARNMPFKSNYFELNSDSGKFLREGGFNRFPCLCPRWAVTSGDIYGNSPAMEALGDIMQLQHQQLRKGQGIDYMTKPPLQVPTAFKNREINTLPAGITFIDNATNPIRTTFETKLNLTHMVEDIVDVRGRINSTFYADLFLMLANITDSRMTATEVAERHEEKLLMLGPVIERIHNEMLDPLIDITFGHMLDAGMIDPPPPEAEGLDMNVEFISLLAQAQKAVAANGVDKYINSMGLIAQAKPTVLDKLDEDYWADSYADILGVDPKINRTNKEVMDIRQKREEAEAAMRQNEALETASKSAKNIAGAEAQIPAEAVVGEGASPPEGII